MTNSTLSLLDDRGSGATTIANAVAHCMAELPDADTSTEPPRAATIGGIGTTAAHALQGGLLRNALADAGVDLAATVAFDGPDALLADGTWDLALVLSPWKQKVAERLTEYTTTATQTGVIDTIVRRDGLSIGVNTNSWAAQAAMETIVGGRAPTTVLVLGSGGSSYSVALGVRRAWPTARLIGCARNVSALTKWSGRFDAEIVEPAHITERPELIVNTTTWGETADSEHEPFMFDIATVLAPGNGYFDLNNRISALQTAALDGGCNVMSGTFMQRVTNACRAALVKASL